MRLFSFFVFLSIFFSGFIFCNDDIVLKSDRVVFDVKTNLMKAYDGVDLFYDDIQIHGQNVVYDKTASHLKFNENVSIKSESIDIFCAVANFFVDKNLLKASENVEFNFVFNNGETGYGSCNIIDFFVSERLMVLKGNSVLFYNGSDFKSDILTINMDSGKVIGSGKVNLNMEIN